MPFNLGFTELLVLMGVSVLVFGGRLPEVARKVAATIGELKRGFREEFSKLDDDVAEVKDAAYTEPEAEPEPPADWERPPDGDDCSGFDKQ